MDKKLVVYTYGVWDLWHYGHAKMISQVKKLGGKVVVGVFTDKVAESFKRKPYLTEKERFLNLKELEKWGVIDKVVYQKELSPSNNMKRYQVNLVAKGEGANFENLPIPNKKLLKYTKGISTSQIIERVRNDHK